MCKLPKRVLSEDYRRGSLQAATFLREWQRVESEAWIFADQFTSVCEGMAPECSRGFRDTVFLFLQVCLQGGIPDLNDETDRWRLELEDPEGYCG